MSLTDIRRRMAVFACMVVLAAGCAGPPSAEPSADDRFTSAMEQTSRSTPSDTTHPTSAAPATSPDSQASTTEYATEAAAGDGHAAPQPAPSTPSAPPLKVEATLAEDCVHRGDQMTILVETPPRAAVGFLAFYAGGETGAAPPYGQGHGGNDGGLAGEDGTYAATWTVAPSAPLGRGHVHVNVAHNGQQAAADLAFEVAPIIGGAC